jgi:putative membrane protein
MPHPPGSAGEVPPPNPNLLRDRLANERTFLAWLRTGIAVSGLGFVVARFDIFLQQVAELAPATAVQTEAVQQAATTVSIGVFLVVAGPALVVLAAIRFWQTERALLRDRPQSRNAARILVAAVTGLALVAGAALTLHIINTWPD